MVVEQPARHQSEQRLGHRQFADSGCAMKEQQFHARSIAAMTGHGQSTLSGVRE
jgi:hypothetical protein